MEYAACQPGRAARATGTRSAAHSGIVDLAPMVQILDVLVPPVVLGGVCKAESCTSLEQICRFFRVVDC